MAASWPGIQRGISSCCKTTPSTSIKALSTPALSRFRSSLKESSKVNCYPSPVRTQLYFTTGPICPNLYTSSTSQPKRSGGTPKATQSSFPLPTSSPSTNTTRKTSLWLKSFKLTTESHPAVSSGQCFITWTRPARCIFPSWGRSSFIVTQIKNSLF